LELLPYFRQIAAYFMKRRILNERNLVVILFVMVFVTFSLAQEDTKKIERMYQDLNSTAASSLDVIKDPQASPKTTKDAIIPVVQFR
jgi:hypothetical protein